MPSTHVEARASRSPSALKLYLSDKMEGLKASPNGQGMPQDLVTWIKEKWAREPKDVKEFYENHALGQQVLSQAKHPKAVAKVVKTRSRPREHVFQIEVENVPPQGAQVAAPPKPVADAPKPADHGGSSSQFLPGPAPSSGSSSVKTAPGPSTQHTMCTPSQAAAPPSAPQMPMQAIPNGMSMQQWSMMAAAKRQRDLYMMAHQQTANLRMIRHRLLAEQRAAGFTMVPVTPQFSPAGYAMSPQYGGIPLQTPTPMQQMGGSYHVGQRAPVPVSPYYVPQSPARPLQVPALAPHWMGIPPPTPMAPMAMQWSPQLAPTPVGVYNYVAAAPSGFVRAPAQVPVQAQPQPSVPHGSQPNYSAPGPSHVQVPMAPPTSTRALACTLPCCVPASLQPSAPNAALSQGMSSDRPIEIEDEADTARAQPGSASSVLRPSSTWAKVANAAAPHGVLAFALPGSQATQGDARR